MSLHLKDSALLRQRCRIGAEWRDALGGGVIPVRNPADGQILGTVPNMGEAETRHAIDVAAAALAEWRKTTAKERAVILRKWYELVIANTDDLAVLMTAEQGKPLAESKGELAYAANY